MMENNTEYIGSEYQYIELIHSMLWQTGTTGITFDDVKLEYKERYKDVKAPSRGSILSSLTSKEEDREKAWEKASDDEKEQATNRAWIEMVEERTGNQAIKKAKRALKDVLRKRDTGFVETQDEKNKRIIVFRYPDDLDFDPLEAYKNEKAAARRRRLEEIGKRLSSSQGLFSQSWLNGMKLQLLKQTACDNPSKVISFANTELKNLEMLPALYQYIINRQVISFKYHPFDKRPFIVTASPCYLKEYNLRWFLIASTLKDGQKRLSNYAIDRIDGEIQCHPGKTYMPLDMDLDSVFREVVGVSIPKDAEAEDVILEILDSRIRGYLETKRIHPSQKLEENILTLHVIVNYELETRLLEFMDCMRIIQPTSLREKLKARITKMAGHIKDE